MIDLDVDDIVGGSRDEWKKTVLEQNNWRITATPVDHWRTILPDYKEDSLAYRVDSPEGSIVFSRDTVPCESLVELARGADLLIHDCFFTDSEYEEARKKGGIYWHTSSGQLGNIAQKAGVKRVALTHLRPQNHPFFSKPLDTEKMYEEVRRSFKSEIIVGKDLLEILV